MADRYTRRITLWINDKEVRNDISSIRKEMRKIQDQQTHMTRGSKEYNEATKKIKDLRGIMQQHYSQLKATTSLWQRTKNILGKIFPIAGIATFISVFRNATQIVVEFDKAQSNLAAALETTKEQIKDLTDDAIRYGTVTKFTASQVTELQTEFAKLGFTKEQIKASTKATLDLAAATNAELGPAATVVGVALNAFNLSASNSERVASAMAIATAKTAMGFEDLQTILSHVGPVANAFNFSLEDTLALTGKLTDVGFDASTAATATRNILLNLADANGALAKALGRPIKSLDDLIPALVDLKSRGIDLNETLQLTDKRSVAAFNAFLTAADKTLVLRDGLIDVKDELQNMVDEQLDNAAGQLDLLNSAWQGFILSIEEGDGVIARFARFTLQFLTDSLIKLSNIDLIFKRAGKFTEDEVTRVYDAMMNLSGNKYKEFQELIEKENKLSIDQVIIRKDAMIEEIKATGQNQKEAELLWEEFYQRRKQQSIDAIKLRNEEEKKEEEKTEEERKNQKKKVTEEQFTDTKTALENSFAEEQNILKQQLLEKKITQTEFNQEMYALELAHLAAMRELYRQHGDDVISIEGQIIDKKLAWQNELNKMLETSTQVDNSITEQERKMFEDIDKEMSEHLNNYKENLDEETQTTIDTKAREKEAHEAARDAAVEAAVQSGMAAVENAETTEEAGRAILNSIRDQIKAYIAEGVVATVKKVLIKVPPPLNLILAAAAGAAASALFNKIIPKFDEGGYTLPGTRTQPAGIVHAGEYVVPQEGVNNPDVRQVLDYFEMARRAGKLASLDIGPAMKAIPSRNFNNGGYVTPASVISNSMAMQSITSDPELKELIKENIKATREFMKWKPKVQTEMIKRDLETLENIQNSRGL